MSATRRTFSALAAAAVGAVLLGTPTAAPASSASAERPTAESAAVGATNAYAKRAFTATNNARRNNDRAALRGDACLRQAALRHARWMARTKKLQHQDLGRIQRDCGVGYVGENIAYGYATGGQLVWRGWMRSSGHRANILSRNYRVMGLASVQDNRGTWWSAQVFGKR